MRSIRDRLTYANVASTLALFIALGGTSVAALNIGSGDIKNGGVRSVDVRNNDLRSRDIRNGSLLGKDMRRDGIGGLSIKESRLGRVPRAANADHVGGLSAASLRDRCPTGMVLSDGVCFEPGPSGPHSFDTASDQCSLRNRFLPAYVQLSEFLDNGAFPLAPGGELTSSVFGTAPLQAVVVNSQAGGTVAQSAEGPVTRRYRCAQLPTDG